MRKVIFGVANSLDNFIARENGEVDWLMWSDEIQSFIGDFWKTIDTILVGRKTYEVSLKHGKSESNPYPGMKTYLFSRKLKSVSDESVEIVSKKAEEFVRNLKNQEGKDICVMGGGDLAKSLFEAGLIDEIGFNIHPVLLGRGIPLFYQMTQQINLELIDCKPFKNGCVLVSYRVKTANG